MDLDFEGSFSLDEGIDFTPEEMENQGSGSDNNDNPNYEVDNTFREAEYKIPGEDNNNNVNYQNNNNSNNDVLTDYLKSKGISEEGVLIDNERVPFNELSRDEQIEILNSFNRVDKSIDLDDEEIQLLNSIRNSNLGINGYLDAFKNKALSEYENSQDDSISVDTLSNDELFLADLVNKIPDITEEEAMSQLELSKQNESVYNRKLDALRQEYKDREMQEKAIKEQEYLAKQKADYEQYENTIVNSIRNIESIDFGDATIRMSDDDMEDIASFILDPIDANGNTGIQRYLQDPNAVAEMAWWMVKGKETLQSINDYYKNQISEITKNNKTNNLKTKTSTRSYTKNKKQNDSNDILDSILFTNHNVGF